MQRLLRAQRLVRPLKRAGVVAERVAGAGLAAVTSGVVLGALPAYPQSWTLPLVAVCTAVWAVVPQGGLAFLLGVLAFPVFNVSLSLGAAYLAFAVVLFLLTRARPIVALWPTLALVLTPLYLTLLAPAGAALLGRVRGPLAAAWAGAGTLVYLVLLHAPRGSFTLFQPRWRLADEAAAAGDPFTVATRILGVALAPACVLQMLLWAGLAVALGFALSRRRLELRLWVWALAFAATFAVYRVVPIAVWGYPAELSPLLWNVALAAGVILLPLVLTTGDEPEERHDGHLQESCKETGRPCRGRVRARLQGQRAAGRARAQARQGDGRPQGRRRLQRVRAQRVRHLPGRSRLRASLVPVGVAQGGARQLRDRLRASRGLDSGGAAPHRPAPRRRSARRRVRHRHAHRQRTGRGPGCGVRAVGGHAAAGGSRAGRASRPDRALPGAGPGPRARGRAARGAPQRPARVPARPAGRVGAPRGRDRDRAQPALRHRAHRPQRLAPARRDPAPGRRLHGARPRVDQRHAREPPRRQAGRASARRPHRTGHRGARVREAAVMLAPR